MLEGIVEVVVNGPTKPETASPSVRITGICGVAVPCIAADGVGEGRCLDNKHGHSQQAKLLHRFS